MDSQINISLESLANFLKSLPKSQWNLLKKKVDEDVKKVEKEEKDEFLEFLLNGPVATEEELKRFEEAGNYINEWRID